MTLFDAIAPDSVGDSQDFAYEGLVIERNDAGHIDRMYVKEGYGGEKTEFLPERDRRRAPLYGILAGRRGPLW